GGRGSRSLGNYPTIRAQERTQAMLSERNRGVQLSLCGEKKLSCVKVNPKAGAYGEEGNWMVLERK
ncbi:mobilization protein, partial [Enterobacter hormaechei]|nr:mobilization protein [Enterobacter hormaechei]